MILLELILPTETNEDEVDEHNENLRSQVGMLNIGEVQVLSVMYDQLSSTDLFADRFDSSRTIAKLKDKISILKEILIDFSRTAKLCLQYMNYVSIIKEFARAERSGNWQGHLAAMGKMLNLFAATEHINYAKSGRLYLQLMLDLEKNYPWLYRQFNEKGFHCIRQTDKFWAGL